MKIMQLKFQYTPTDGMTDLVTPANSVLQWVSLHVLRLESGASYTGSTGGEEQALVVMSGMYEVEAPALPHHRNPGRRDVFEKRAPVVYLPPGTPYTISATGGMPLELVIGGAKSDRQSVPCVIEVERLRYEKRGVWHWERHIYDSITSVNPVSQRLYVIEVYTPPGNWSSVPPHKHDTDNPPFESAAEEIYYYKMKPEQGFGFQRIYTDDGSLDQVELAQHSSAIIQPRGYHPVANHPGYQMYYLNLIAGEKRLLLPNDDPQHRWVKDVEAAIKGRG
jgi:5-deoxy-glucuronate isomerase